MMTAMAVVSGSRSVRGKLSRLSSLDRGLRQGRDAAGQGEPTPEGEH